MLSRRDLPETYRAWNQEWGAPFGHMSIAARAVRALNHRGIAFKAFPILGPFGYQSNSLTRTYEFPWAFNQIEPRSGMRILEIGGALSGLQFALSKMNCDVHNVDPFVDYGTGEYAISPQRAIAQMNSAFQTSVKLHSSTLSDANIDGEFDVIYSISTLEHIAPVELREILRQARQLLSSNGKIILSVDLFLDIEPFTTKSANAWGTNISPLWIQDILEMPLTFGNPAELYGYPEFSIDHVLRNLPDLLMNSSYPQLAQLMVFG